MLGPKCFMNIMFLKTAAVELIKDMTDWYELVDVIIACVLSELCIALMQIVVSVKRIRREFGASCTFTDRNADKVKDGIIDCPASEEKSVDMKRMELDRGTQVFLKLYYINCLSPDNDGDDNDRYCRCHWCL